MTDPGGSQQPDFNKPNDPNAGGYVPPAAPPGGGGFPPPAGGGYGQPGGGYGQPGGQPAGSGDDKTWILVAHFGGAGAQFITGGWGGWIPPLIAFLVQGPKSPNARQHALAALNFQITWSIVTAAIWIVTTCLGLFIPFAGLLGIFVLASWAIGWIIGLIAGIKANNGEQYTYPLSFFNFVK
jgi:uncharacterized Tic20 family protein